MSFEREKALREKVQELSQDVAELKAIVSEYNKTLYVESEFKVDKDKDKDKDKYDYTVYKVSFLAVMITAILNFQKVEHEPIWDEKEGEWTLSKK